MSTMLDPNMTLADIYKVCTKQGEMETCEGCEYWRESCAFDDVPSEWKVSPTTETPKLPEKSTPAQEPVQGEDALRDHLRGLLYNPVSPAHYQQGKRQTLDEMIIIFGLEAVKSFCLCNVYKYKSRAGLKNGQEDLAKADRYLTFYEHLCEYGCIKWDELEE